MLVIGGYDPVRETTLRSVELLPGAPKAIRRASMGGTGVSQ
jgi:hypothetical protein